MMKLIFVLATALGLAHGTMAVAGDSTQELDQFAGTYQGSGTSCAFAPRMSFQKLAEPGAYELAFIRADGGIWNTRDYRSINGPAWYQANLGPDGTIWGRSRFSASSPAVQAALWSERRACHGRTSGHCERWSSTEADRVEFSSTEIRIRTSDGQVCDYVKLTPFLSR